MRRVLSSMALWALYGAGLCGAGLVGACASEGAARVDDESASTRASDDKARPTRYREGDYVVYLYDGAAQQKPVTLVEEVVKQDGNRLHIEVEARLGEERRRWLQVVTDTPENQAHNVIDELYLLEGEGEEQTRKELANEDNRDVFRLYAWTLPPQVRPAGEAEQSEVTVFFEGVAQRCTEERRPVLYEGRTIALRSTRCPDFLWTHGPAALLDEAGHALWSVRVVEAGRRGGQPPGAAPSGWEGFYPPDVATSDRWLGRRNIPILGRRLASVRQRVVKLVLDGGERKGLQEDLSALFARTCAEPESRAWNEDRCRGLQERECGPGGDCTYRHFGNCSGFLLGAGRVLTAAHCVADLSEEQKAASAALLMPAEGEQRPRRRPLGAVRAGKDDFAHHWVAMEDPGAVDVALVELGPAPPAEGALDEEEGEGEAELLPWPTAEVPPVGAPVFIHGFPRVNGRSEEVRARYGYDLLAGTPSFSFGEVAERNEEGLPLCSVDGRQEHWQLASPCPAKTVRIDGKEAFTGPLTAGPALFTYDSLNGYSGAPVFDRKGRLVAVNATLISPHDPQSRYGPQVRQVATPIGRALRALNQ